MKYGLIGKPLGHSFSREIHALVADYDYELFELDENELEEFLNRREFFGINVTIPYKQEVIPFLDEISDEAKKIGAVNTIVNKNGKLFGYNTDFFGMKSLVEKLGVDVKNKKVLILGTGGTSKTSFAVFNSLGAAEILKVSRKASADAVTYEEVYKNHTDAQIVVNTTPVGMFPKSYASPLDLGGFCKLEGVVDAVYNPLSTNLVSDALKKGAKASGGLYMLVAQAVYASALFTDSSVDLSVIDDVYDKISKEKRNIVLCGMPSCGKTTTGKKIAKICNKKFFDVDDEVVKTRNETISEIFKKYGEKEFRKAESEVVERLSCLNGLVIATGGGTVLNESNVRALKRNGIVVFLDRNLENLVATDDRPLSSDKEKLEKLFNERYDVYKSCADIVVDANGNVDDVVEKIRSKTL